FASALDAETDLICQDGGDQCSGEQTVGLMYVIDDGPSAIYPVSWSVILERAAGDDWDCQQINGHVTCQCRCLAANINTGTGPINTNEPSAFVLGFEFLKKGCTNADACNYDPNATLDDGTCLNNSNCAECGGDGGNCIGCTDPQACNYSADAYISDTCFYPDGCADEMALNYDPNASCDDGSCIYPDGLCGDCTIWDAELGTCVEDPQCAGDGCFGDSNTDGAIDTTDLLAFLSAFGGTCE
ncbi:MAG: hypothetical protein AAF193_07375, partial [Bacteroidota bacterium]